MGDIDKTKEQLINELTELRQRVARLEASEVELRRVAEALRESESSLVAFLYRGIEHLLGLCNYVAPSVAGSDDIQ